MKPSHGKVFIPSRSCALGSSPASPTEAPSRYRRKLATKIVICLALPAAFVILSGCGGYYTGEIAGYIKDSENAAGINGAVIRIYAEEPASASEDGFIVETASMSSGGNGGYFSHKIIWQSYFPAFGEEGDSGSVWLGIVHGDYTDAIAHVRGVISDTVNVVPDILLVRATFETPEITGRLVDVAGEGVNGIRLELDLASTTDEAEDYVTTTATIDGNPGTYRFQNVSWRDEAPDSPSADTESATVIIDDPDYESAAPLQLLVTSDQAVEAADTIVVTRKARSDFSVTLQGRCINRYTSSSGVEENPAPGVEVTVTYKTQDDTLHTLYDQTDGTGSFSFFIQWTDDSSGDFDGPSPDGADDSSIPEGEDGLYVQIQYDTPFNGEDVIGGDANAYDGNDFLLKSWIDPNVLPDAVVTTAFP